jgi:hypothetical protein
MQDRGKLASDITPTALKDFSLTFAADAGAHKANEKPSSWRRRSSAATAKRKLQESVARFACCACTLAQHPRNLTIAPAVGGAQDFSGVRE